MRLSWRTVILLWVYGDPEAHRLGWAWCVPRYAPWSYDGELFVTRA